MQSSHRGNSRGSRRLNRGRYLHSGNYIQLGTQAMPSNQNTQSQFLHPQTFQNISYMLHNLPNIPDTRFPPPNFQTNNPNNTHLSQIQ